MPPMPEPTHNVVVGHDIARASSCGMEENVHADAPPAGLAEKATPLPSTPTQKFALGQLSPKTSCVSVPVQLPAPPAGSVEVSIWPFTSSAMHNEADGHSMSSIWVCRSMLTICQSDAPPVGLLVVSTLPAESTPAQNELVGQEMESMTLPVSRPMACQAAAPPVGLVEKLREPVAPARHSAVLWQVTLAACRGEVVVQEPYPAAGLFEAIRPASVTATHSAGGPVTQDTWAGLPSSGNPRNTCQAEAPAAGSVDVSSAPVSSNATHNAVLAHETLPIAGSKPNGGFCEKSGIFQVRGALLTACALAAGTSATVVSADEPTAIPTAPSAIGTNFL